jgi:hypothetical protein
LPSSGSRSVDVDLPLPAGMLIICALVVLQLCAATRNTQYRPVAGQ